MAPVGSYESLMAAIQGGADSIYFGIEGLNMRSRSSNNFTTDDLRKIVAICREHGIKSYLTVNTVIYGEDLPLMREIIDAAKEAEVSAIIAADVAAMNYANSIGQEVHLSTQLNISNAEALKFYARFADVVVLARELNLKQVHEIYQQIVDQQITGPKGELIRIEMFAHGALCMAVSGKCYLSLHEMNASANRGACMQICRRAYSVKDKDSNIELDIENQYIMSPKDLKTIHFMNKMMDAGVRVFKIEGRARGPEYVRTVVECYKEAIRSYLDGTFTDEKIAAWDERLKHDSSVTLIRKELLKNDLERESKKLKRAEERLEDLIIKAPIGGQLSFVKVTPGQQVASGESIAEIKVLDQYKIHTSLSEYYIDRITTGLPATVNYQGKRYPLRITKVVPEVKDRMFDVDLVFTGEMPENVRVGKSFRVQIELGQPEQAIVIPRGNFYQSTGGQWIYKINPSKTKAVKVPLNIGRQNPLQYEITEGLQPGEFVIITGYDTFGDAEELILK